MEARVLLNSGVSIFEKLLAAKMEGNCIKVVISKLLLVIEILMAVGSLFQNRRFCLIFEIGGFVPFPKSAVFSHLKSVVLPYSRCFKLVSSISDNMVVLFLQR